MKNFYIHVQQYHEVHIVNILDDEENSARNHLLKNLPDYGFFIDSEFPAKILKVESAIDRFKNRGLCDSMVDKVYAMAYDRNHYAGELDVENSFISMMYELFDLNDSFENRVCVDNIISGE